MKIYFKQNFAWHKLDNPKLLHETLLDLEIKNFTKGTRKIGPSREGFQNGVSKVLSQRGSFQRGSFQRQTWSLKKHHFSSLIQVMLWIIQDLGDFSMINEVVAQSDKAMNIRPLNWQPDAT